MGSLSEEVRTEVLCGHICDLEAENAKLRELLDFALPIAMYAASTEEGDRMRELMREIGE